jgi:hypothetical protein
LDVIDQTSSFKKLKAVLAEWMTLIELCDDLLERIELYGIAHYIDMQQAEKKLRQNWGVHPNKENETLVEKTFKSTKGVFGNMMLGLSRQLTSYLSWFGLVGMV